MSTSLLNPAKHVERIREIIMGRDLNQVHGRLKRIENDLNTDPPVLQSHVIQQLETSFSKLQDECHRLRSELHQEKIIRKQQLAQIDQYFRELTHRPVTVTTIKNSDELASKMTARIDARFREIMSHLQTELLQWRGQLNRDMQALRNDKVDRQDVMNRFTRIASAAIADDENNSKDGYLL